jgi:hypothetical protein
MRKIHFILAFVLVCIILHGNLVFAEEVSDMSENIPMVLEWTTKGGFTIPLDTDEKPPDFALYGNRLFLFRDANGGVRRVELKKESYDELIGKIVDSGILSLSVDRWVPPKDGLWVTDQPTTEIILNLNNVKKNLRVYAFYFYTEGEGRKYLKEDEGVPMSIQRLYEALQKTRGQLLEK